MPSTTSSSVSRPFASSTVMTPSLPTFCIASAIISPIARSLGRDRADLSDLLVGRDLLRARLHVDDDGLNREVDAALQIHRVKAGGNRLRALAHDRLGEQRRGGSAVTGLVAGP